MIGPPLPSQVCRTQNSVCVRSADCCPRLVCKALIGGRSGYCQPCRAIGQACSVLNPCCAQLRCERAGSGSVCRLVRALSVMGAARRLRAVDSIACK